MSTTKVARLPIITGSIAQMMNPSTPGAEPTAEVKPSESDILPDRSRESLERAYSQMVEDYTDFAYNVAYRMLRNVEDAEDAVQEAFISAYRAFSTFKGQSKLSTWLYRIVVNACLMKIRKEKARSNYLLETGYNDAVVTDWGNYPEEAAINSELRDVVETGLQSLSPDLRAAVVLRDVQGLTTEEASATLGLSIAAFKSRLHRGRIVLRSRLSEYFAKQGV